MVEIIESVCDFRNLINIYFSVNVNFIYFNLVFCSMIDPLKLGLKKKENIYYTGRLRISLIKD